MLKDVTTFVQAIWSHDSREFLGHYACDVGRFACFEELSVLCILQNSSAGFRQNEFMQDADSVLSGYLVDCCLLCWDSAAIFPSLRLCRTSDDGYSVKLLFHSSLAPQSCRAYVSAN